jgi:hypothetical protein
MKRLADEEQRAAQERQRAAQTALDNQVKAVRDAFNREKRIIEDRKFFGLISLEEEIKEWEKIQARYITGTEERREADRTLFTLRNNLIKEQTRAEEEAAKKRADAEKKHADEAKKRADQQTKDAAAALKIKEDAIKAREKAAKDFYDFQKLLIQDYRNNINYTISEEIAMWESLGKHYTEVSKEKIEIDSVIIKLRENLRKEEEAEINRHNEETFNSYKHYINERKTLNLLTIQEEIEAWGRVTEKFEESTKQREEADKNLFRAREDLRKAEEKAISDMEKLEQKYTDAVERRAQAIFSTFGLMSEVDLRETDVDKNTKAVQRSQEAYEKANEELRLANEAFSAAAFGSNAWITAQNRVISANEKVKEAQQNLTEATETASRTQANVMSTNLQSQIDAMTEWERNIARLANEAIDGGLLEELRKMGPTANRYLEQLLESNEGELEKLSALYQEKHELARNLAVNELQELRRETDEQISDILTDLKLKMNSEANPIGENMIQGIIDGLLGKADDLYSTIARIMQQTIFAAMDALQIGSPSKLFAKMVGLPIPQGIGKGISDNVKYVDDAVSGIFDKFDNDYKFNAKFDLNAASSYRPAHDFAYAYAGASASGGASSTKNINFSLSIDHHQTDEQFSRSVLNLVSPKIKSEIKEALES